MAKWSAAPGKHVALLIEASRAYARGLVRGVARYNREHAGWLLSYTPQEPRQLARWLADWHGDGILARIDDRRTAAAVLAKGLPVVELRRLLDLGLPTIGPDDCAVSRLAIEHLVERGFRQFGFCAAPRGAHPSMDARREHFTAAVAAAGYRCVCFEMRPSRRGVGVWEAEPPRLAEWIAALPKPTGVMACNDDCGLQVLDACRQAGVLVPDELAVIGAGNDDCLCSLAVPPLTSVDLHPQRIGYEAAALLARMMSRRARSPKQMLVAPRGVVMRMSTDVLATEDEAVLAAVRFIRQHACEAIQVGAVLRHVKMSRAALEPRMKAVLQRTIHQEIERVRIQRVCEMLATIDAPLKQIAQRAGYRYPEYMMRAFRRVTGETPGQYRKRLRM